MLTTHTCPLWFLGKVALRLSSHVPSWQAKPEWATSFGSQRRAIGDGGHARSTTIHTATTAHLRSLHICSTLLLTAPQTRRTRPSSIQFTALLASALSSVTPPLAQPYRAACAPNFCAYDEKGARQRQRQRISCLNRGARIIGCKLDDQADNGVSGRRHGPLALLSLCLSFSFKDEGGSVSPHSTAR